MIGFFYLGTCTTFFEPTIKWLDWMEKNYRDFTIIDCGAGLGHVTKSLRARKLKVIPIDLYPSDLATTQILWADGRYYPFEKNSIVLICRPCHDGFVMDTILNALQRGVKEILYISKAKNFKEDIYDLPSDVYAKPIKLLDIGTQQERMWSITKI